jgi:antitoxin (DNA-binding transcriptional repressor) of toxin-antitoxin stability system
MTRDVTVEELQDHLEERLSEVREGVTLRVLQNGTVVAEMNPPGQPTDNLRARRAIKSMRDVVLPPPLETKRDIVEYLLEERGER